MCPKADDPITTNQNKYSFQLLLSSSTTISGNLYVYFQDEKITLPITNTFSNSICEQAFESSLKFDDVTCVYKYISNTVRNITITVNSWPLYPQQNNLYTHNGIPDITDFTCDITLMSSTVNCAFSQVTTLNVQGKNYSFILIITSILFYFIYFILFL